MFLLTGPVSHESLGRHIARGNPRHSLLDGLGRLRLGAAFLEGPRQRDEVVRAEVGRGVGGKVLKPRGS